MHEQLLDYLKKQHQHLEHYLALCFDTPDAEVVHQLRVSIKRIRAIFLFAEQLAGNENFDASRHYRPLRKLFRMAGDIRDIQVQQNLVAGYAVSMNTSFELLLEHLDKLEKRSISRFFDETEHFNTIRNLHHLRQIIQNSITPLKGEEIREKAFQMLTGQCDEIRRNLVTIPGNKELHRMRTIIKQMHYILGVLRKSDPAAPEFPVPPSALSAAEVLLGQWHDRIVGIELLENFRKKMKKHHEPEKENYKLLSNVLLAEQRLLKVQIRRSLTNALTYKDGPG
jgi:CHAD domain-containing protein